jgi:hypothetical protein
VSRTFARRLFVTLFILALLPYVMAPVYRWPAAQPFAGPHLWNPYADAAGPWRRANFHAHAWSWGGATAGAQGEADVVRAYRAAGYDVAGLSQYQTISPLDLVPAYEHGYNLSKHHQLALGARAVVWWDFPFWQGLNEKQYVLDRLRESTEMIAINHPARLHGYTVDDVRRLTGYELMEIANGHITTEDRWDAALSSGRPVWGIGGDDTHDVGDSHRFAVAWTMIAAPAMSAAGLLDALRLGRSYVVVRTGSERTSGDLMLSSLTVDQSRIVVQLDGPASVVTFSGQDGRVLQATTGTSACYDMATADTYVRTVVHGPKVDLYLNPVIRTAGGPPSRPQASVDQAWTAFRRTVLVLLCVVIGIGGLRARH